MECFVCKKMNPLIELLWNELAANAILAIVYRDERCTCKEIPLLTGKI